MRNRIIVALFFSFLFFSQQLTAQQLTAQQLDSLRLLTVEEVNETSVLDDGAARTSRLIREQRREDRLVDALARDQLGMDTDDLENLGLEVVAATIDTIILLYDESAIEFSARERLNRRALDNAALRPFGRDFFRIANERFLAMNMGPVNADYILGVGDEIVIQIWGEVQSTERHTISRNGSINATGIGQVVLAGRNLREARQMLLQRYSRIYSGVRNGAPNATTFIEVTTGTLRQKSVIVVGEVERPGNHLIPSTAGVIHAVARAGGPTNNASLRNVIIRRRGAAGEEAVDTVDLYNFFLDGIITDTVTLADFDVVLLNPIEKYVHITGAVRRPGRYELREGETFADLIRFAGGLLPEAHTQNISIERTTVGQQRQNYTLNKEELNRSVPRSNDFVTIDFVDKVNNTVSIEGAVERPGVWGFSEGMRISDLLNLSGGVLEEFFGDRIILIRTDENFEKQILAVNMENVLNGRNDIPLQKWDVVRVFSIWDLQFHQYVDVFGMVARPGRYFLRAGMTIQDVLLLAGGFEKGALRESVEISRIVSQNQHEGNRVSPVRVNISAEFFTHSTHELQHQDVIFVRQDVRVRDQEIVYLGGEFLFPGHYAKTSRDETLIQLIGRAGGFRESAYLDGTIFTRSKNNVGQVAIDFERWFGNRRQRNDISIILEHGDSIIAVTNPKTVTIGGSVNSPTAVRYVEGASVRHYINRAGGLTLDGKRGSIYVVRANGEVREARRLRSRDLVNSGSQVFAVDGPPPRERQPQLVFQAISAFTATVLAGVTILIMLDNRNSSSD